MPCNPLSSGSRVLNVILAWLMLQPVVDAQDLAPAQGPLSPRDLKMMSVEELLRLQVITVSRQPQDLRDTAGNLFLLTGRSWKRTGANRLTELLRLAPNLFVAQASASQWAVNARGFVRGNSASNTLLVMVDGRSVYSPLFSNVFWDTTNTFLPDLQQIEVISGAAGASWGSNAVNGAINIETKAALDTRGMAGYLKTGRLEADAGFRIGWKLGEESALRVYVQRHDHGATFPAAGMEDNADDWRMTQAGFRGDWTEGPATVTFSGDVYRTTHSNGAFPQAINDGYNLLTRWSRDLASGAQVWVQMYYDYARRDSQVDLVEATRTADVEFQYAVQFDNGQALMWGGNYRRIADAIEESESFAILPHRLESTLSSVFVQHRIGFFQDALQLTTGLRLEHNHYSEWEHQPNVRLAWLKQGGTVWLAVSRATRIPSRLDADLYIPNGDTYLVAGGPEVRAETVQTYEVGWRTQPAEDLSLTLAVYSNDYDHLRSLEITMPPFYIANGVNGRSHGVEMFADWSVTHWWRMRAGGFWMEQETWVKPGGHDLEQGQGECSFPKYQFQVSNLVRIGSRVVCWTALRHVAAVPVLNNGGHESVPSYTELDINLAWNFRPGVDITLSGKNLLHDVHPEMGPRVARRKIPRSFEGGLKFQY